MTRRRAQAAVEFLILAGVMALALMGLVLVLGQRSAILNEQAQQQELAKVAEVLRLEVMNAQRVQDGYERAFELPATAGGEAYTMRLEQGAEVTLRSATGEYVLFLPFNVTINQSGTLSQSGALRAGRSTLRKTGGRLYIS